MKFAFAIVGALEFKLATDDKVGRHRESLMRLLSKEGILRERHSIKFVYTADAKQRVVDPASKYLIYKHPKMRSICERISQIGLNDDELEKHPELRTPRSEFDI